MILDVVIALVISVTSGIILHYVIKWLDSDDDNE